MIKSIKDLDKVMALCRKRGVSSITIDNITFHLGEIPKTGSHKPKSGTWMPDYTADIPEANVQVPKFTGDIADPEQPQTDELTQEQLMMWSVTQEPAN